METIQIYGTSSVWKVGRVDEKHCVHALGVIRLATIEDASYLLGASVYPFGCVVAGAKVTIFLEFAGYMMEDRIDGLVQFLWIEVFFVRLPFTIGHSCWNDDVLCNLLLK